MTTHAEVTWMTLLGLSLIFVGGFVLWVYGAQRPPTVIDDTRGAEAAATRKLYTHFVQWFLLYGAAAVFAGIGCLLTATMIIL